MGGEFAILFWLMAMIPDGALLVDRYDANNRLIFSLGSVEFQTRNIGSEIRVGYMFDQFWGRFNPTLEISITDSVATWAGVGLYQQFDFQIANQDMFAGFGFAPGYYLHGESVDLGHALEFRSSVELGIRLDNDWQISLLYDHRSNGDISKVNPGLETFHIRFSKSFN